MQNVFSFYQTIQLLRDLFDRTAKRRTRYVFNDDYAKQSHSSGGATHITRRTYEAIFPESYKADT